MKKPIYFAPMEGVTDNIFRSTYESHFGGIEKYFTPFLSPNDNKNFPEREWREIDPARNDVALTIPQLLTNKSEHFLWAVNEIAPLGYKEINLNLGCPSGTVVAKKKGSGLLYYPEELDKFLYEIYEGCPSGIALSIKTRLGKNAPEEFYEILDVFNKYPISELTIHPRIQSDYYREPVRMEYFDYAVKNSQDTLSSNLSEDNHKLFKGKLVYNGEIHSLSDVDSITEKYPDLSAIMIGRGLIENPMMLEKDFDSAKLMAFHDDLMSQYQSSFSGDIPVLHRMKELWSYWQKNYADIDKPLKTIRKAKSLAEYRAAVNLIH